MRRFLVAISLIMLAAMAASAAAGQSSASAPAFVNVLANARFVYVASFDGDEFNPDLLPEDRNAIEAVQTAIQQWGKLVIVYQPAAADVVLLVSSRPGEDVIAAFDARSWERGNYVWRAMAREGLQRGETPLVTQFEKVFESVQPQH